MRAVDTNVLIAAHRVEHERHVIGLARLTNLAESRIPWALPVFCIAEFVRVVTHPRVFSPPSSLPQSTQFIERLLESPSVEVLLPRAGFWTVFSEVLTIGAATGNLAYDAQIAALCMQHGVEAIVSEDRDFARFPFLRLEPWATV